MKAGKWICASAVILCAGMLFASCNKAKEDKVKEDIQGIVTTTNTQTEMFQSENAVPPSTDRDSALARGIRDAAEDLRDDTDR